MEIGIIGLPLAGKTTAFRALTRLPVASDKEGDTHLGVVKVPDHRLEVLAAMFSPQKVTPAEVRYLDLAVPARDHVVGRGLSSPYLAAMGKMDALIHVVRAFADPAIPHEEGSVDPERDMANMDMELAFADMALIERRIERIDTSIKAAKAQQREAGLKERQLLERIKAELEREAPLRAQALTEEEAKAIANYAFLTQKPLLTLVNIGEEALAQAGELESQLAAKHRGPGRHLAALCAKLEAELGDLSEAEAEEFRADMGLLEEARERAIRLSYELLGLITFFTVGADEVRAWTVRRGALAPQAAGKVHSDMERGFIRAEAVAFDDLVSCGSLAEARHRGLLRTEGRNYVVQDGDVMTFLFSG